MTELQRESIESGRSAQPKDCEFGAQRQWTSVRWCGSCDLPCPCTPLHLCGDLAHDRIAQGVFWRWPAWARAKNAALPAGCGVDLLLVMAAEMSLSFCRVLSKGSHPFGGFPHLETHLNEFVSRRTCDRCPMGLVFFGGGFKGTPNGKPFWGPLDKDTPKWETW